MISIKKLYAGYGDFEVLHNINLDIEPGKVTILIGPNGCGKSTLLKTLIRLNEHSSGQILIDEEDIKMMKATDVAKKIAYLPQGKHINDISVNRMVLHGRFAHLHYPRRYRKEDYEMANKAMKWVGIDDIADKNVSQLSGGTQQKVYIAMALAQDTPTILLDEPTTYLDISHQIKLLELSKQLASEGKAVVMVLHDLAQALRYAHRIIVMKDGYIVANGNVDEIYESKVIDTTFDIHLDRVKTKNGWQYYYE